MGKYVVKAKLLLCLLLFNTVSPAQQPVFTNQQHFGVEEGLPQSFISGIIQDEDGFIWISTLGGFCRYDGRGFKTFHYRPNDSTGLAANSINNLGLQRNNIATLYYDASLADNFNLRTFKVSHNTTRNKIRDIPNTLWQMYGISSISDNSLFIMADYKGAGWLNSVTGKVTYANRANGLLQQDTITAMIQSAEGKLYLVSENGVQVSDTALQRFEFIRFATHIKKLSPDLDRETPFGNYSIVCLPNNRLAISDIDKIIVLDISKKTSHIYPIPPPQPGAGTNTSYIVLQVDVKGRLYFANYGRVFRLIEQDELKLLWQNTIIPDLRISTAFIDRSDVLWVSINAQGLLKIDLQALPFQSYRYKTNFMSDIMEQAGAKRMAFPPHWNNMEATYDFRQAYDSKGNLYACYNLYDKNQVYQFNQQGFGSLPHIPTRTTYTAMLTTPDDEIWVFDKSEAAWYRWKTPEAMPEKILLNKESMQQVELADAKYIGGYIWLSTYSNGLLQYQGNKRINQFDGPLPNGIMPKALTEICPDPADKNKFWIGSRGGGLILWDVQKGLQHVYTIDDGLPNNTIYCILPDKTGKIWCSSNKGIFRFDVRTKQITAFEKTDGLSGNEFNRAHKFIFPDGRLAFGGLDGYTIFNPSDLDSILKTGEVPVSLTGLQINNQPQDMSMAGTVIKEPLTTVSVIDLPYYKNYLRFEFAALLFNQPQKTKYRYQLKGADDGWVENGTNNIASYAALRPGNYTFRINATDNNGLWSDAVKEIIVIIHPPFWATWWAYLIYALIAVGLIRWYFIFRERRIKAQQNLAFEKREAIRLKEVDEMKDRFFSNITHEFRTPLTLIITPLEKLVHDPSLSAAAVSTIKIAQRNSKQLLRLINEFLDFSKLNDGQLKLKLSTGELDLFTKDCVRSFEAGAKEKNIQFSFSSKDIAGLYLFDEDKWEKIITNLLSNALKFTPQNGEVSVLLSAEANDTVRLQVKDNGPGIPADQQQKIFNRFYQVDDSAIRTYGGTGIGLSLVKELTELMQGTIKLESKPGNPTRFIVEIPMQKIQGNENIPSVNRVPVEKQINNKRGEDAPLLLVIEDNDELRAFLIDSMHSHYRVMEAADGLKGWDIILQELPDIVISDVMMPGRDGFDLCRICKTDNRTAHIGFILLTSKAAHDARLKGLETGADDYITKPFNLEELELRTANLLQLQQKQRAWLQSQLITTAPQEQLPAITDPFLLQLYQEMDAQLDNPGLGVDWLCKIMAMSRSTLNRKLKSLLDISPNDLVRQYRLQKATRLLSSGVDITSASYKVGFSSPSYFSQCFKEQYGITPSDWISEQRLTQN